MPSPVAVAPHPFAETGETIAMQVLLRGEETGGSLSLFQEMTPPGVGPPLHIHYAADEFFRVLEGQFRFRAGEDTIEAAPGASVFVPRGTPHCFLNTAAKPGHLFMGFTPGGAEGLFDWIAENGLPDPDDKDQAAELRRRYDVAFLGPNPFMEQS